MQKGWKNASLILSYLILSYFNFYSAKSSNELALIKLMAFCSIAGFLRDFIQAFIGRLQVYFNHFVNLLFVIIISYFSW